MVDLDWSEAKKFGGALDALSYAELEALIKATNGKPQVPTEVQAQKSHWEPGGLVPLDFNPVTGEHRFGAPQVLRDLWDAFMLPGEAAAGLVTDEEAMDRSAGFATSIGLPGIASGIGKSFDPELLSIFGGRNAKDPDLQNYMIAQRQYGELDDAMRDDWGLNPANLPSEYDIWQSTGWFRGADDNLKFEIDDSKAEALWPHDINQMALRGPLNSLLYHPELYKQYPEIANLETHVQAGPAGMKESGYFALPIIEEGKVTVPGEIVMNAGDKELLTSGLLHEVQHWVQRHENFAPGGNPKQMGSYIAQAVPEAEKQLELAGPFQTYQALMGEVEARNVQRRMRMDAGERKWEGDPHDTEDLPRDVQLNLLQFPGTESFIQKLARLKRIKDAEFDRNQARMNAGEVTGWPDS